MRPAKPKPALLAFTLASDLLLFIRSALLSRTALAAENLFLRKQLAFYREHKLRPQPIAAAHTAASDPAFRIKRLLVLREAALHGPRDQRNRV